MAGPPPASPAARRFGVLRRVSFVVWLAPALWLGGEAVVGALGPNPLNRLLHVTGRWALIMLLVTLAVTPARRLSVRLAQAVHARWGKRVSDWNGLIRLRRQFGLFAFFYAGLHLAVYAVFDVGLDAAAIVDDARQRPFILLGFMAFALLVPLAATSHQAAVRALGRGWRRLHQLSYGIAVLALIHFWLQTKAGQPAPTPYAAALALLLAARLPAWWRGEHAAGCEVQRR